MTPLPLVIHLFCLECRYVATARSVDAAREALLEHRACVGHLNGVEDARLVEHARELTLVSR